MNTPGDCCTPCPTTPPVNIPGTPGLQGQPGTNGFDAFSILAANINVPAVGANVNATFDECAWMAVGQNVFMTGPANFQVVSVTGTTGATLKFLGYSNDVAPGTVIAAGVKCSPSGLQGGSVNGFGVISVVNLQVPGSGSYTPSVGTRALYIECIGGGGSGGGGGSVASDASCGSGGGGGSYAAIFLFPIPASFAYVVGAGGVAPTAGNNPGNPGSDTLLGPTTPGPNYCLGGGGGAGGAGGAPATTPLFVAGGSGGAAGTGDISTQGDAGGFSNRVSGTVGCSGKGGNGPWGGGSPAVVIQGNGTTGGSYGAGGSGGNTLNGGAASFGGAGAGGLIRVWELG